MTNIEANTNNFAPRNQQFRLVKYSYTVKHADFVPSDDYKHELKDGKVFINLHTVEERKAFYNDLNKQNVKAREVLYEYFVPSKQFNTETVLTFNSLVKNLKDYVKDHEEISNLVNCFKIVNDKTNFKVIVSSYNLATLLNKEKMFLPYRSSTNRQNVNSTERTINVRTYQRKPQNTILEQ